MTTKSESLLNVYLYEEPSTKTLDLSEIRSYLREKLGDVPIEVRGPFLSVFAREVEPLARKLAGAKVRDLTNPYTEFEPLRGEVEFELKLLRDPGLRLAGVLYDGFRLQAAFQGLLPADEFGLENVHIAFTNRLFGTFNRSDGRYHARVSVYGFPSLISTTGIVEAPAKPKGFYELKRGYAALGADVPLEVLKERFKGRFIDYDDERLTEVMKGYVMQALFYHLFGEPFCDDKRCRLVNAHWQEEVLEAQLGKPEFCERHAKMLEEFKSM